MEWNKEECPYWETGQCAGDVHVVDEGEGYIAVACDIHADLVAGIILVDDRCYSEGTNHVDCCYFPVRKE